MESPMTAVISFQFALFFASHSDRPDLDFADINDRMMNIFDAMPTIVNIPMGLPLPSDIPIITHKSESGEYLCNISRSRIDFLLNQTGEKGNSERLTRDFNLKVSAFIDYVLHKREVNRFGLVCNYFYRDDSPVNVLLKKYFKDDFESVEELSIRFNHKKIIREKVINDVITLSAAIQIDDDGSREGVLIQRDINSDPKEAEHFSKEELHGISRECSSYVSIESVEGLIK
jgi:hypothetical protein